MVKARVSYIAQEDHSKALCEDVCGRKAVPCSGAASEQYFLEHWCY